MASPARKITTPTDEQAAEAQLCRQIDNLERISVQQRKDQLGEHNFKQTREDYNLSARDSDTPVFRPQIKIPEGQMLGFMEAIDLADIDPRIYLVKSWQNYEHDADKEACFQAYWRDADINRKLLYIYLLAWLNGTGFMQTGFDPTKRQGRGDVTCHWRDPETVLPDPYAIDDEDWQYLILKDFMWYDRVRELWPFPAQRVRLQRGSDVVNLSADLRRGDLGMGMEVPRLSPMNTMMPGLPVTNSPGDARLCVRTLFTRDSTRVRLNNGKDQPLQLTGMAKETYKLKYPRGRMIIECNGVILFDGENPYLHGEFPIIRFLGMPALHGFWAPPPIRYTMGLQTMAERFLTQDFENDVRTLNGVWFIDEQSGIDPERFGGVPGEVQVKAAGSPTPEFVQPKGNGGLGYDRAEKLLSKQRMMQGFGDSRVGKNPQGNVSNDLFLGAISQGQTMTRGRALLNFQPIRRLAYQLFVNLAQYTQDNRAFADPRVDGFGIVNWEPIDRAMVEKYVMHVDPASIQPYSGAMLRAMVPALRNMGLLDVETALEWLRAPNRKKTLERLQQEAQMKAQMELEKKSRGKSK